MLTDVPHITIALANWSNPYGVSEQNTIRNFVLLYLQGLGKKKV